MYTKLRPFSELSYWHQSVFLACDFLFKQQRRHVAPIHVVTVNAEMVLHATETPEVAHAITQAQFFVADSTALHVWLCLHRIKATHITGTDLSEGLLRMRPHMRVALLGGFSDEIRKKAGNFLTREFESRVVMSHSGPQIASYSEPINSDQLIQEINHTQPEIIFVGFGHGKQEWWIQSIIPQITYSPILIGVGGVIDVWGGHVPRVPLFIRTVRLEWLWRLIQQPSRLKRIIRAVIVFPYRALKEFLLY